MPTSDVTRVDTGVFSSFGSSVSTLIVCRLNAAMPTFWVTVSPPGAKETQLLLAKAATPQQTTQIGCQAGGRVFLILNTDDFRRDHAAFTAAGVKFLEEPREEEYGTVAVFEDLYGNKWDLLQTRG